MVRLHHRLKTVSLTRGAGLSNGQVLWILGGAIIRAPKSPQNLFLSVPQQVRLPKIRSLPILPLQSVS
jgi:hypothetical protein